MTAPLAERMRPKGLDQHLGQEHLSGPEGVFRQFIRTGHLPSLILWGPPGVGKTSLAQLLADQMNRPFYALSAIHSGVKDIREVIDKAQSPTLLHQGRPILFIDEIHRFSKSQQDSLLGAVEKGVLTLVGATTENPSFEVIPALLSRCQVYTLNELSKDHLISLVQYAIETDGWLKSKSPRVEEYEALLRYSGGDARKLLNALELVVASLGDQSEIHITNQKVNQAISHNLARYDKSGEQHYDIVSAFIKSIRGSDPNAAVYYLARMIHGGEDPVFIARRMLILASEDIGNANPNALLLAEACFQSVQAIGMPESRIILSQCAIYLASSAKSNSSYLAIDQALDLVRQTGDLSIPLHLRNAPTKLMKDLGYGDQYQYSHNFEGNFVNQEYLPSEISGTSLVQFGHNPREQELKSSLIKKWLNKYRF